MTLLRPFSRIRRAALPLALCAGLTATLAGCGGDTDPDAGTNGVGKLDAPAIEKKAKAAADRADAVRLAGTLVSKGGTYKLNMQLKPDGAVGSVTTKNGTFELLRVEDALFLKAAASFWAHEEPGSGSGSGAGSDSGSGTGSGSGSGTGTGKSTDSGAQAADKLDDKYVKVPEGDPSYKQLRGFTDMRLLLDGLLAVHGDLVKGDHGKIGGVRTINISGGQGGEGGSLDVALDGEPFPVRLARGGGAGVVVLSEWDRNFALDEPAKGQTVDYGKQLPST
ncbi:hypothetical protein ABZ990_18685 [Streptomyces sp. NPDC046203]|uniref:hypothetical protein n=1 Tax=Streptomyces sp. NPDC046203 TaxID=3154602 RepID=UPI0033C89F11